MNSAVKGFAYPLGSWNKRVVLEVSKYYYYARLGGRRFESRSWNAQRRSRYLIKGITPRELVKLPLRLVYYKLSIKPVIIFHREPLFMIEGVIKTLKAMKANFVTLYEISRAIEKGYVG